MCISVTENCQNIYIEFYWKFKLIQWYLNGFEKINFKILFSTFGFLKWTVFCRESQTDVVTVMRAVQPDVVMLELCKSRTNILQMDEETILSESQNLTTQRAVSNILFSL